jgi:hypothetical protein
VVNLAQLLRTTTLMAALVDCCNGEAASSFDWIASIASNPLARKSPSTRRLSKYTSNPPVPLLVYRCILAGSF